MTRLHEERAIALEVLADEITTRAAWIAYQAALRANVPNDRDRFHRWLRSFARQLRQLAAKKREDGEVVSLVAGALAGGGQDIGEVVDEFRSDCSSVTVETVRMDDLGPNHADGCDGTQWTHSGIGYERVRVCACGAEDHDPEIGDWHKRKQ